MGRCKKDRCCRRLDSEQIYKPTGIPMHSIEMVTIELDEFEVMRLCDTEDMSQIEAAEIMQVSRGTVQRLLKSGRSKIISAILHNRALYIKGYL